MTYCDYPNQTEWLQAARDAVVRGEHGKAEHGSDYVEIDVDDNAISVGVVVDFHGTGANGYVETLQDRAQLGPHGWHSSTSTRCPAAFTPSYASDTEFYMLSDFFYHVGEVAKTNNENYHGSTVVYAAQLSAPGSGRIYYSPQCAT